MSDITRLTWASQTNMGKTVETDAGFETKRYLNGTLDRKSNHAVTILEGSIVAYIALYDSFQPGFLFCFFFPESLKTLQAKFWHGSNEELRVLYLPTKQYCVIHRQCVKTGVKVVN